MRRKIWTIFEDSIRHTNLIKDRHLDQLLMCAIYVICKVGSIMKIPDLFTVIMRYYRLQPQACSSVYRDVLIERAKVVGEYDLGYLHFIIQEVIRFFLRKTNTTLMIKYLEKRKQFVTRYLCPNVGLEQQKLFDLNISKTVNERH